jgi:hypothetical protein
MAKKTLTIILALLACFIAVLSILAYAPDQSNNVICLVCVALYFGVQKSLLSYRLALVVVVFTVLYALTFGLSSATPLKPLHGLFDVTERHLSAFKVLVFLILIEGNAYIIVKRLWKNFDNKLWLCLSFMLLTLIVMTVLGVGMMSVRIKG